MVEFEGRLIILEGVDEVGKSTLGEALVEKLRQYRQRVELLSFPGRESGTLGGLVYNIHHHPEEFGICTLNPGALQTMHVASHVDAIEQRITPLLSQGVIVVLDRFWWSTIVYGQVAGLSESFLKAIVQVEEDIWSGVQPDIAFLIECEQPRAPVPDIDVWKETKDTYRQLASKLDVMYPIYQVMNDSHISKAATVVLNHITAILPAYNA